MEHKGPAKMQPSGIKFSCNTEDWPDDLKPGKDLFEIEAIVDYKIKEDMFLVIWKGYALTARTWEPRENVRQSSSFDAFCEGKAPVFSVEREQPQAPGEWEPCVLSEEQHEALVKA